MLLAAPDRRAPWREAALAGCGFTLGFGWLWFGGLQPFTPRAVLWGGLLEGGGTSLFFGILLAGLLLYSRAGPGRGRPFAPHAAACCFMLVGLAAEKLLASSETTTEVSLLFSYVPAAGFSLAALCLGLYWGAVLLRLTPFFTALALTLAALLAAPLSLALAFLERAHFFPTCLALPLCVVLALLPAGALLKPYASAQAGLPAQKPPALQKRWPLAGLAALFAAGVAQSGVHPPLPPLASSLCWFFGAALAFLALFTVIRLRRVAAIQSAPLLLLCCGPLLPGLSLLFFPPARAPLLPLGEGLMCGGGIMLLCSSLRAAQTETSPEARPGIGAARRAAAKTLAALIFCGNAGTTLGNLILRPGALPFSGATTTTALGLLAIALALSPLALLLLKTRPTLERPRPFAAPLPDPGAREAVSIKSGEMEHPAEASAAPPPERVPFGLTAAEQRVAALLLQGFSNADISDLLSIAPTTTRVHLRNIYRKTSAKGRQELLATLQIFSTD